MSGSCSASRIEAEHVTGSRDLPRTLCGLSGEHNSIPVDGDRGERRTDRTPIVVVQVFASRIQKMEGFQVVMQAIPSTGTRSVR